MTSVSKMLSDTIFLQKFLSFSSRRTEVKPVSPKLTETVCKKNTALGFHSNEIFLSKLKFVSVPLFLSIRDVHQKWIEGGNYELCIEDVRDEIWDMVKPTDPLKITLQDLLVCKQGGTVASMLIDVRGFWAHDNRENLLQEEEEPEEEC